FFPGPQSESWAEASLDECLPSPRDEWAIGFTLFLPSEMDLRRRFRTRRQQEATMTELRCGSSLGRLMLSHVKSKTFPRAASSGLRVTRSLRQEAKCF